MFGYQLACVRDSCKSGQSIKQVFHREDVCHHFALGGSEKKKFKKKLRAIVWCYSNNSYADMDKRFLLAALLHDCATVLLFWSLAISEKARKKRECPSLRI